MRFRQVPFACVRVRDLDKRLICEQVRAMCATHSRQGDEYVVHGHVSRNEASPDDVMPTHR